MTITELRRSGTGALENASSVSTAFSFTGTQHSSAQGEVSMSLKVESNRRVIPGSNRVVEHLMSSSWQPVSFSGEWDDKWGNRRTPPNSTSERSGSYAFYLYQEFAQLVQRMSTVRVELDALSLVGVITEFTPTYVTKTHIKWTFTLSPHENENLTVDWRHGPSPIRRSLPQWLKDCADLNTNIFDLFDRHLTVASLKTPRMSLFKTSLLAVSDAVTRLQQVGRVGLDVDAVQQLKLLATTFRRLRGAAYDAQLSLAQINSSTDVAFGDTMLQLTHAQWISDTITSLWRAVGLGADGERDMQKRIGQDPRAIHYPRAGESLEKISSRYYGAPDSWRLIYDRNHLTTLVLDGTEELVIPRRTA